MTGCNSCNELTSYNMLKGRKYCEYCSTRLTKQKNDLEFCRDCGAKVVRDILACPKSKRNWWKIIFLPPEMHESDFIV